MKLTVYEEVYLIKTSTFKEVELDCKGTGNEVDPAIIDSSQDLPNDLHIMNNSLHIHVKEIENRFLTLRNSKNIIVEDCSFISCIIDNCSKVRLKNNAITKYFFIQDCRDVHVFNSIIKKFRMAYSRYKIVKNCEIEELEYPFSKDNIFEGNQIPEKQLKKLSKSQLHEFLEKWGLEYPLILGSIFVPFALILDLIFKMFPIIIIVVLSILILIGVATTIGHYLFNKRMEKGENELK